MGKDVLIRMDSERWFFYLLTSEARKWAKIRVKDDNIIGVYVNLTESNFSAPINLARDLAEEMVDCGFSL
jgi:hypothetical protein